MRLTSNAVAALLVATRVLGAEAGTDPQRALASLPGTVTEEFVRFDQVLAMTPGVDHWRLAIDDAIVLVSSAPASRSATPMKIALPLRAGDNMIALESLRGEGPAARPLARWTTHVYRSAAAESRQFALLVDGGGRAADASHLASLQQALLDTGFDEGRIHLVDSWPRLVTEVSRIARDAQPNDRTFIYYSGGGSVSRIGTEPLLHLLRNDSDQGIPAGDLIREVSDLPSASVLLDIAYVEPASAQQRRVGDAASSALAAPWLRTISHLPNVEVAYTNPFAQASAEGFTNDFIAALRGPTSDPCQTFATVAQTVARTNSTQKAASWPVYFAQRPSSLRFCTDHADSRAGPAQIAVTTVPAHTPMAYATVQTTRATGDARPVDVIVDGVMLVRRPQTPARTDRLRVPVGRGSHVIEVVAAGDRAEDRTTLAQGLVHVPVGGPAEWHASERLRASVLRPLQQDAVTSAASIDLAFVVHDLDDPLVQYEVRNNGVIVLQDVVPGGPLKALQTVRRIPLDVGANHVVVEVKHGNRYAGARANITRRRLQPVRAVVIGIDAPAGAVPLAGAEADAVLMKNSLLRYTDALPGTITMLTGGKATRQAILDAIASAAKINGSTAPSGGVDETLVLYIAGYGLTISSPGTAPQRCIVPADFDPRDPARTCITTQEIDRLLDAARRSVVIADTSYDGLSRAAVSGGATAVPTRGRTYADFLATDTGWRLSSGADRPDRVFLVANGTNETALETSVGPSHGVFTQALSNAVQRRLDVDETGEMSLYEAYARARDDAANLSGRREIPVMKGVLSAPFLFARKPPTDIKREAAAIHQAAHDVRLSMHAPPPDDQARAAALYEKAVALDAADIEARQGLARMLVDAGDLTRADAAVHDGLAYHSGDPGARAAWLLIRAELNVRRGQLEAARGDCEESIAERPSLEAQAFLGLLHMATLHYDRAALQLESVLRQYGGTDRVLGDEEWGRLILATYISMRRAGWNKDLVGLMLESFAGSYRGTPFRVIYRNAATRRVFPWHNRLISLGDIDVQAPWSHVVAQYFLHQGRPAERSALYGFRTSMPSGDSPDDSAFTCLLHFYVGMSKTVAGNSADARAEFAQVVAAARAEYVEYWIAKAELDRLQGVSAVPTTQRD